MEKLFRLQAPKTSARKEGLKQGEGRGRPPPQSARTRAEAGVGRGAASTLSHSLHLLDF